MSKLFFKSTIFASILCIFIVAIINLLYFINTSEYQLEVNIDNVPVVTLNNTEYFLIRNEADSFIQNSDYKDVFVTEVEAKTLENRKFWLKNYKIQYKSKEVNKTLIVEQRPENRLLFSYELDLVEIEENTKYKVQIEFSNIINRSEFNAKEIVLNDCSLNFLEKNTSFKLEKYNEQTVFIIVDLETKSFNFELQISCE